MKVLDKTISQLTIDTPFNIGDTHIYLLKGDTLSLVDAGVKTKAAWESVKDQLKEIGYSPDDIEQVILTHHHPDHTGLIGEFPRLKSIIAHENVDIWLRKNDAFHEYNEQFFNDLFTSCGVPSQYFKQLIATLRTPLKFAGKGELTSMIDEGDFLPGHNEWKVIETKGHAQTHLSFLRESDGLFIGGDHLLQHTSSNPLIEAPYEGETKRAKSLPRYRKNLLKCLSLKIDTVLPGHGNNITNVTELITHRIKKQDQRALKVRQLLIEKTLTPFQICQQLFPHHYQEEIELTMSETIGQLDFLEQEGVIDYTIDDGTFYYFSL